MARRVTFSAGHRYWRSELSPDQNRELFGAWASPFNHGHNYVLWVTVEGRVDPVNGMVVNIKRIDDVLQERVVSAYDQKSLNDEVAAFADRPPSLENMLRVLADDLGDVHPAVRLTHLRVEETPLLFGELDLTTDMLTLTRVYEFAASHRLNAPTLSPEENVALYGKCNNPMGHGHNYVLEVTVSGQPDPRSGMMVDLAQLDARVEQLVVDRYDHKNLDADIPEFQGRVTTSEIVAQEIFARLDGEVPGRLEKIRLFETARNVFEVSRA